MSTQLAWLSYLRCLADRQRDTEVGHGDHVAHGTYREYGCNEVGRRNRHTHSQDQGSQTDQQDRKRQNSLG